MRSSTFNFLAFVALVIASEYYGWNGWQFATAFATLGFLLLARAVGADANKLNEWSFEVDDSIDDLRWRLATAERKIEELERKKYE